MADDITLYRYKYKPCNVVLTIGDETFEFRDGCITYLNFIHDYTRRRFPVIQCGMEMETRLIKKLYENEDNSKLKLDVYEYQIDKTDEVVGTVLYLQDTFSIIPANDQTVYITSTDSETESQMDVMKTLQNFQMYLIDMEVINWFTQEISIMMEEVTYSAALQALFVERKVPKGLVVATPPQQTGKLHYMVVPLQDLIHNIRHLNNMYGLYDGTPIVYYDLKYLYCVAKKTPNIIIPSATDYGTIKFLLKNPTDPTYKIAGSFDDAENQLHLVNLNREPEILDNTTRDVNTKFSTLTAVNSLGKVTKTTIDEEAEATTLKYIYSNNDLTEQQVINENMYGRIINLGVLNTSVKFLTPYKDYIFDADTSYDNLDLNGYIFRIIQFTLGIHREGSTDYLNEATIVLYNPVREPDAKE